MVAIFWFETLQPPENGAMKFTIAGEGGLLKVPMAVNATWPFMKFCASAVAGATVIDCRARLEFIIWSIMLLFAPHPATASSVSARQLL